jgi:hypothetical protein
MIIFLKNTLDLPRIYTLLKIHNYSIIVFLKNMMYWANFKYFLQQVAKEVIQIFICMGKKNWAKGFAILVQHNIASSLYYDCTPSMPMTS